MEYEGSQQTTMPLEVIPIDHVVVCRAEIPSLTCADIRDFATITGTLFIKMVSFDRSRGFIPINPYYYDSFTYTLELSRKVSIKDLGINDPVDLGIIRLTRFDDNLVKGSWLLLPLGVSDQYIHGICVSFIKGTSEIMFRTVSIFIDFGPLFVTGIAIGAQGESNHS